MRKWKILMVAGDMHVGGIENQLMHLLRHCDPQRFQIDFTSTREDAFYRQEIESLGGHFHVIPPMSHRNPLPYCRALYRLMKAQQYDVVHSHELFHSGIVLAVARMAGVPARFVHAHNQSDSDGTGARRSWIRAVYNRVMRHLILGCATRLLACSTPAGRFLYGEKAEFRLLYNSVDTAAFLPEEQTVPTTVDGWSEVLHAGRMTPVKNQLFLVEIAAQLKARNRKIRILCVGSGCKNYTKQVQQAVEAGGLQNYLKLLGVRKDMPALMRKARAFVLPSKYEGMPLVLLEAQAAGVPCVAADTFSREADFGLGAVCWLPKEADAAAWADALGAAIDAERPNPSEILHCIEEKGFDSRQFARILCNLYEESVP